MYKCKSIIFIVLAIFVLSSFLSFQFASATTYTYTLGPIYYDDNTVVNGAISVKLYYNDGSTATATVTQTSTPNTTAVTSSSHLKFLTWNASSTCTRVFTSSSATATTSENISLTALVTYGYTYTNYTLSVIDFAGMNNPFIEVKTATATTLSVGKYSLNSTSSAVVTLGQFHDYNVVISCDAGTYTQTFFADTTTTVNIPVLAAAFPVTNVSYPTLNAVRTNTTAITFSYDDPTDSTDWLYFNLTHANGLDTILDYTSNTTGNTQTIVWNGADADKSYFVTALSSYNGTSTGWVLTVNRAVGDNPFTGVFDFLGTNTETIPFYYTGWPNGMNSAQIAQLIAAFIITMFLGIGSFRNAGASCVMAWIVGGIMLAIGWWNGGLAQAGSSALPEFVLAGFLSVIIAIQEGKQAGGGLS